MKKRNAAVFVLTAAVLFFLWPARAFAQEEDVIAQGISVGGVELGGLSKEEARAAVEACVEKLGKKTLTIKTDTYEDQITLERLGISWDNDEIIEEAFRYGKDGNLLARYKALESLKYERKTYALSLSFHERQIRSFVEKLAVYDVEPVEPTLVRRDGAFVVEGGTNGIRVDIPATVERVKETVNAWNQETLLVEAAAEITKPERDPELLRAVKDQLGSYSSNYASGNLGRSQSLELSARRLDGTVIYPGETISVSALMGPRTIAGGYGVAGAYIGNDVVDSVGAGICQTASTLYAAALYAELTIVERHNHSMTVNYMPAALDATIYAGNSYTSPQKDLKIRNDYGYPVYIAAYAGDGTVSFVIYGKESRPAERSVSYVSHVISEIWPTEITWTEDPGLPYGYQVRTQGAYAGVTASLTKVVSVNGTVAERTLVHTDKYKMVNEKWTVGVNQALAFDAAGNIVAAEPPSQKPPEEGQEGQEGQPEQTVPDGQPAEGNTESQGPLPEEQQVQEPPPQESAAGQEPPPEGEAGQQV